MREPKKTDWISETEALDMLRSAAAADGVSRTSKELRPFLQDLIEHRGVLMDDHAGRTRIDRATLRTAIAKAQGGLQVRPGGPIRS